jgi:hypothetical protein
MFSGDDFPLGPNGRYPKQRINSAGNEIAAPEEMEGLYGNNGYAKLPVVERDFNSSLNKVKGRMKQGKMMRSEKREFRPRYTLKSNVQMDGDDTEGLGYEMVRYKDGFMYPSRSMSTRAGQKIRVIGRRYYQKQFYPVYGWL